jgi:hypothetical protein
MTLIHDSHNYNTAPAGPAEVPAGMDMVRQARAWHFAGIAYTAVSEAADLCELIYHDISGAYLDIGQDGADTSQAAQIACTLRSRICEAIQCLLAAVEHLEDLKSCDLYQGADEVIAPF